MGSPPTSQLIQLALKHHEDGRLGSAEELYEQVLRVEPEHAEALHFSGLIAYQKGQTEVAVALMMRAIESAPENAIFFLNLAQVFEAAGELDKAAAHYRKVISLSPGLESAHRGLGNTLLKQGSFDEAAASYAQVLRINPASHETINSLGSLLRQAGRLEQSVVCFRKAIALEAGYAEAHNNLAISLNELGRSVEAIACCDLAILHKPTLAAAHCNLGNILNGQGDYTAALLSCRRAITLEPELVEAHLNMGNACRGQGRLEAAIRCYQHAISLSPHDAAGIYNNLAETLKDQDRLEEAVAAFQKAIAINPNFSGAYSNLLYLHAFTRDISPEAERVLAEGWEKCALTEGERIAARSRASAGSGVFPTHTRRGRKLRLGIVSAELGSHAVAEFLQPVLDQLDRSRFHLTLFPTTGRFCSRARYFQDLADDYIPLAGVPDAAATDLIRSEQIDILIDTTGHTYGSRLGIFAHRAAPVQCTYIGYWSTTGLTEMDWFFGDPYCGASLDAHFSEGLWRLPRMAVSYKGDTSLPESSWSRAPDGTVWLGCFNKYGKIREQTLRLWAKVLHALPEAKLLLEDAAEFEGETHQRILGALSAYDIPGTRVEFIPFIRGHERHMRLYDRVDIALDTIPFNSGTTAFDALWMGVPLIALEGNWLGGKMGSSVLTAFNRKNWVAQSEEEYVSIVRSLARDVEQRKRLRKTQRADMAASPLCDAKNMAHSLEEAFEAMYDQWIAGGQRKLSGGF